MPTPIRLVPALDVTRTLTTPTPAGAVAVICESLTIALSVAPVAPKLTAWAPRKPLPEMVTSVPPPVGPLVGEMLDTTGITALYVNLLLFEVALGPSTVVTITSTTPTMWAGDVAEMRLGGVTTIEDAGVPPKVTVLAAVKLVPEMTTLVPPVVGPLLGETPVTVGATASAVDQKSSVRTAASVTARARIRTGDAACRVWVRFMTLPPGLSEATPDCMVGIASSVANASADLPIGPETGPVREPYTTVITMASS